MNQSPKDPFELDDTSFQYDSQDELDEWAFLDSLGNDATTPTDDTLSKLDNLTSDDTSLDDILEPLTTPQSPIDNPADSPAEPVATSTTVPPVAPIVPPAPTATPVVPPVATPTTDNNPPPASKKSLFGKKTAPQQKLTKSPKATDKKMPMLILGALLGLIALVGAWYLMNGNSDAPSDAPVVTPAPEPAVVTPAPVAPEKPAPTATETATATDVTTPPLEIDTKMVDVNALSLIHI